MNLLGENGIVARRSAHSVEQTVKKLEEALTAKGIRLFAIIDHSGEAERVGLQMPKTKLVIFGHPKAGTPIMLASPTAAIDLPLKILIAEDTAGSVWVSYNSTTYLQGRHGFPQTLAENLSGIEALVAAASE